MIITTVTSNEFHDAFKMRPDNFSYDALEALFNFFDDLDLGDTPYELDVIAICCEFAEYENINEVMQDYQDIHSLEDLYNHTMVIELDNGGLVISQF